MNELDEIYKKIILDYNSRKDLKREVKNPDIVERGHNSSCGDDIYIMVKYNDDKIEDIGFIGHACAICTASCAMLVEMSNKKNISYVVDLIDNFFKMIKGENFDEDILQDSIIFEFVSKMPARIKCATLSWHTLKIILEGKNNEHERNNWIYKKFQKKTPCELITDEYIADTLDCKVIGKDLKFIIGEYSQIEKIIKDNSLKNYHIKVDRRNSAIPLLDVKNINARIEPGAIIRDNVTIGNNSVIMMGAVINIGAVIGDNSMIDMNAVLGGRAIVGKNCHVGAGAVLAGVIEPESAKPVELEDNVLIGANAVVLEGVKIKKEVLLQLDLL